MTSPDHDVGVAAASAGDALDDLRARLAVGAPPGRLDEVPPRVARAVALASDIGAPAMPALTAAVDAVQAAREREHAATVATAQARAVAIALASLPLIGVPGLSVVLDRPLVGFYTTAPGRAIAAVGIGLAMLGVLVSHVLTDRQLAPGDDVRADEAYDLVATAVTAGLPPGEAVRAAAEHLPDRGPDLRAVALAIDLGVVSPAPEELAPLAGTLATSLRWGAPAAHALRELARQRRADERARVAAAAERLPAVLTFPTVLLLLPASLTLVGAPVLASGLDAVSGA